MNILCQTMVSSNLCRRMRETNNTCTDTLGTIHFFLEFICRRQTTDNWISLTVVLLVLSADGILFGGHIWAAIIILAREVLVSGLREFLGELQVSVPVTQIAKWKTTVQLIAIGFLIAGPAGDLVLPGITRIGIAGLWIAAGLTLYTGYDYFRAGIRHVVDEE